MVERGWEGCVSNWVNDKYTRFCRISMVVKSYCTCPKTLEKNELVKNIK